LIACADVVLLNVTVFPPGANVPPLFVQSPATLVFVPAVNVPAVNVTDPVTVSVAGGVKLPCVSVRLPATVIEAPPAVFNSVPTVLLMTRLLNVFGASVPKICCAPAPSNVTVPVPGVNTEPVAWDQFTATVMVAPAVNVPADIVSVPLTSIVAGAVKSPVVSVKPFTVKDVVLPPTLSSVPAVFVKITLLNV
jgi:hypothetical protein